MFRVLTHRRKSRLTSPRFVVGSIAAHLYAALVVVSVSRAAPAPPPPEEPEPIWMAVTDPPPPVEPERTPPPAPARPVREGDTRELPAPTTVPDRLPDIDPDQRPVDEAHYTGEGRIGDTIVSHPRTLPTTQPPGDGPPSHPTFDGPLPAEYADSPPVISNSAEAGRLLQRHYPDVYADAGVAGRTVVEVVVEASGRVRPGSARVVETTHEQFAEAALRIIGRFRFEPATVADQPIAVQVLIPIEWRPVD